MLSDRQLRDLLSVVESDAKPDEAFEAALFARLAAARASAGVTVRGRRWFSEFQGFRGSRGFAWAALLLALAALLVATLVAGAWRAKPFTENNRFPSSPLPRLAAAQLEVGLKVALPGPPDAVAVDPGQGLWVATGGKLVRLDLVRRSVGEPLDLGGSSPSAIQFYGSSLYVVSRDGGALSKVDYVTGQVIASVKVDTPVGLALDTAIATKGPDAIFAGHIPPPPQGPGLVVISANSARVAEFASGSLRELWHAAVPGAPILVAAGGSRIWVAARPADAVTALVVAAYEAGTGKFLGSVRLHSGWTAPRSIAVGQTGDRLGAVWVPDPVRGGVAVIDPASMSVARVVDIGPDVSDAAVRPGGSILLTYAADPGDPTGINAIAVVDPRTDVVRRYLVRPDPTGGGRGVVGLTSDTFTDGSCCMAIVWHVWFGMDWDGDPSVGRVDTAELP